MSNNKKRKNLELLLKTDELILPVLPEGLEASLEEGKTLSVQGTNVVRVPFGIRQPRRQRPDKPENWATLVLPLQPQGHPTPPPQAA